MIIATNISAMNVSRNLKNISGKNAAVSEKLSSGLRINKAADDSAGLAISQRMKAQIRGLKQAQGNIEDGINLIKIMDGGMNEIQEIMIRQRELIIQAANDTNTPDDRQKIQIEIDQLTLEIASIAEKTNFNTIPLLSIDSTVSTGSGLTTLLPGQSQNLSTNNPVGSAWDAAVGIELVTSGGIGFMGVAALGIQVTDVQSGTQVDFGWSNGNRAAVIAPLSYTPLTSTDPSIIGMGEYYFNSNGISFFLIQKVAIVADANGNEYFDMQFEFRNDSGNDLNASFMFVGDCDYFNAGGSGFGPWEHTPTMSIDGNGTPVRTFDSDSSGAGIPSTIDIINNTSVNPALPSQVIIDGDDIIRVPDRVFIGQASNLLTNLFGYSTAGDSAGAFSDAAYGLIWNNIGLSANGGTSTFNLLHGAFPNLTEPPPQSILSSLGPLWIHCGANSEQGMFIDRYNCRPEALGIDQLVTDPYAAAMQSLSDLDNASSNVTAYRANAGAQQNRLEFIHSIATTAFINSEGANSLIEDANMAKEMTEYTKTSTILQASLAMMAQVNKSMENVLQLLR